MSSHSLSSVAVGGVAIHPLFYRGQPVLTFAMIDAVHRRPEGTARRTFRQNKTQLRQDRDYFHVTRNLPMSEIRTLEYTSPNPMDEFRPFEYIPPKGIILLTESGYLLLVKSFTDALAWEIQRHLVQVYFRAQRPEAYAVDEAHTAEALGLPHQARVFHSGVKVAVDGRALHQALGNQRHFCDWIKQRLSRYPFVENEDFLRFSQASQHPAGGRPSQEYALSVAMAKVLCVLENNPAGWALFRRLQAALPVAGHDTKARSVSAQLAQLAQLGAQVEVLGQRLEALSQRVEGLSSAGPVDDLQPRLAAWLCGRQQCTLAEVSLALFGLAVENLSRRGQQRLRQMLQALGWRAQRGQAVYQPAR